jgi:hypothetical protein
MQHALRTGCGSMILTAPGDPFKETVTVLREGLFVPAWKTPPAAPRIAEYLPTVRALIRKGEFKKAAELADTAAAQNGCPPTLMPELSHPAIILSIMQPGEEASDYLHILDMRSSLIRTMWETGGAAFSREMFCSRKDGIGAIRLKVENGRLNVRIRGSYPDIQFKRGAWTGNDIPGQRTGIFDSLPQAPEVSVLHDAKNGGIFLDGVYAYGRGGFATAVRVFIKDGAITAGEDSLLIADASETVLLIRCEKNNGSSRGLFETLDSYGVYPDFDNLLAAHTAIHTPLFARLSVDLGGPGEDYLLSTIELKQKQFLSSKIVPAYMEAMVDMGRFFLLSECGQFPPIYGHVNVNVNHQVSGGNIGNLPEMMESFFRWIEAQIPDARENAGNILGARGIFIACHPESESGKLNHFSEFWPHHYWISGTGWCLNPFLEHYYCTGDEDFLIKRVLPLYKEAALLYEDFLTERDENGKFMFVPSYSPENFPANVPVMAVINATMDISVCREVLTTLISLGKDRGIGTAEDFEKWEKMLQDLPDYCTGRYDELKEWAWKDFEERYDHRHISQLYGAYPGDEFQPELDSNLYNSAFMCNRMRAFGNESCHGVMHRAQAAARLKDSWLTQKMIRFVLESGFVTDAFTTVHNPYYRHYMPDGQGALPTVLLESLCYSRPGFVEPLPALPEGSFRRGTLKGMALRSFVGLEEMSWDLDKKIIHINLMPLKDQQIVFCYRKGIASLSSAGALSCERSGPNYYSIGLVKANPVSISACLV